MNNDVSETVVDDELLSSISQRLIEENLTAYEELAK